MKIAMTVIPAPQKLVLVAPADIPRLAVAFMLNVIQVTAVANVPPTIGETAIIVGTTAVKLTSLTKLIAVLAEINVAMTKFAERKNVLRQESILLVLSIKWPRL